MAAETPTVLFTRAVSDDLVAALHWHGIAVQVVPLVEIALRPESERLQVARRLHLYDWTAVTSAHAVRAVLALVPQPETTRLAAVGPKTAEAARRCGWTPECVAPGGGAAQLVDLLADRGALAGARIAYPCSALASSDFARRAAAHGAQVWQVPVYDNRLPSGASAPSVCHGAVCYSPSAVQRLVSLDPPWLSDVPVIAIGPTTAAAAREAGLHRVVQAESVTEQAVIRAVVRALQGAST